MGCFDSVYFKNNKGEEFESQFKFGECIQHVYEVGDEIDTHNGVFIDYDSAFVVYDKKIVAAFDEADGVLFNKWGGKIAFPDINRK